MASKNWVLNWATNRISLLNGQGTSGVLCGTSDRKLLVMEYLYQKQFALKQYDFYMIQDINGFPPCNI